MPPPRKSLADDVARQAAIAIHDRSFLVEAGAGSGKTAVMAGRIAMMLAEGRTQVHRRSDIHRVRRQRTSHPSAGIRQ